MATEEKPVYEKKYSKDEQKLANHIIGLEKSALDKWFNGDTLGYEQLWSKRSFTYFDAVVTERLDDHATIAKFLETIKGKLFAESYDFRNPRVQVGQDMAVLTFQVFVKTTLLDMEYNCIEVYQKEVGTYTRFRGYWANAIRRRACFTTNVLRWPVQLCLSFFIIHFSFRISVV